MVTDTIGIGHLKQMAEKLERLDSNGSICPKCDEVYDDRFDGCHCDRTNG